MKICVLGAGVVGVSTAFALGRAGHEVHVIDGGPAAANGASGANGAQLSYSYVDPFACPATLRKLPTYLSGRDPAVRLGLSLSPAYLSWGLQFLGQCRKDRAHQNMLSRASLARRSQLALQDFREDCQMKSLSPTGQGKIVLASSDAELAHIKLTAIEKATLGIKLKALNPNECYEIEPALKHWQGEWAGGLYAPEDVALDPLQYCKALKNAAEKNYDVTFHFNQNIQSIKSSGHQLTAVETDTERHDCSATVMCLGPQVNGLLGGLGLSVPIYPVQGYSLTLPTAQDAPKTSITDLKHKVVFSNLGDSIRIAGFMDTNQRASASRKRGEHLLTLARRLWPGVADFGAQPHHWTQFRPMTPSGMPIIGQSKLSGLFLNVGHGALGYTFAAGSAMIIADLLGQKMRLNEPYMKGKKYA